MPFQITYNLVLRVFLDDGKIGTPLQQFTDISIVGILVSPCLSNTLTFFNTLSLIEYNLNIPSVPFNYQPILLATFAYCPVSC